MLKLHLVRFSYSRMFDALTWNYIQEIESTSLNCLSHTSTSSWCFIYEVNNADEISKLKYHTEVILCDNVEPWWIFIFLKLFLISFKGFCGIIFYGKHSTKLFHHNKNWNSIYISRQIHTIDDATLTSDFLTTIFSIASSASPSTPNFT